jgi:hypothetical protein
MPSSPLNGMEIRIKDVNGYSSTCQIQLDYTSNNTLDLQASATINSNFGNLKAVYVGGGSSGNWCLF